MTGLHSRGIRAAGASDTLQSPHAAVDRRLQSAARVGRLRPGHRAHRAAPLAGGTAGVSRRVARTGRACARPRSCSTPPERRPVCRRVISYEGISVQFARDPGNADELLERLIAAHDTPRKLVVVSGDHRVQRAARRRRATAVDSDRWWAELCAERRRKGAELPVPPQKPTGNLSAGEVDYWVDQFSDAPPGDSQQDERHRTGRRSRQSVPARLRRGSAGRLKLELASIGVPPIARRFDRGHRRRRLSGRIVMSPVERSSSS